MANSKILTAEQERALRQPIDEYVGGIPKRKLMHSEKTELPKGCRVSVSDSRHQER